ncbi:MAG TPA: hypothetical protein VGM10_11250 [Actinocrinis sp.]|jgi:hypothetical protein
MAGAESLPEWFMPPRMIGGHVTGPAFISRSDRVMVAVRQVLAFPVGVEFEIEAHARGPSAAEAPPESDLFGGLPHPRFRLRFADGTQVVQDDDTGLRGGRGPMLSRSRAEGSSGGPDNGESVRLSLWLWPLPPPGPLTLTCSWPHRGLQDASIILDADAIRAAADRARPFWPEKS